VFATYIGTWCHLVDNPLVTNLPAEVASAKCLLVGL